MNVKFKKQIACEKLKNENGQGRKHVKRKRASIFRAGLTILTIDVTNFIHSA